MQDNYFTKNAIGITVIHLMATYSEDDVLHLHPAMDYHLHNLLYHNKELGYVGVLCLDTNDLQTMPYGEGQDMRQVFNTLTMETAQFFVDKIDSMIGADVFDRETLFERAEQELWDKFNEIKECTFVDKLPRLAKYLNANRAVLHKGELDIKKEPNLYKWAEISLTEERLLAPAAAKNIPEPATT